MIEYPERSQDAKETKGKGTAATLRRYRAAKQNLIQRAESLKGKDETRRRKLLKAADNMKGEQLSTEQIRRKAALAELDLVIDDVKNRG